MTVVVDTSVLSLAFRRRDTATLSELEIRTMALLKRLAFSRTAVLIGMVRQEALTGVRSEKQFDELLTILDGFVSVPTLQIDYDTAARCSNLCRAKGIATAPVDMLVCAVAIRQSASVLTVDGDFDRYARCIPVSLYQVT